MERVRKEGNRNTDGSCGVDSCVSQCSGSGQRGSGDHRAGDVDWVSEQDCLVRGKKRRGLGGGVVCDVFLYPGRRLAAEEQVLPSQCP